MVKTPAANRQLNDHGLQGDEFKVGGAEQPTEDNATESRWLAPRGH